MSSLFAGVEPLDQSRMIAVTDSTQVGEARRAVGALCMQLAFDETAAGRVAIVATELATNVANHGGGGYLLVRALRGGSGLELLAVDTGPGMADVTRAMRDGFSTGGTPGKGLGAVERMSEEFDIYTQPGRGTVVMSRMLALRPDKARDEPLEYGLVAVAAPNETQSGDAWCMLKGERGPSMLMVDGLGHGASAYQAAVAAVDVAQRNPGAGPSELIDRMHRVLHGTRGAAVAVAELDRSAGHIRFAGIGNISGSVIDGEGSRSLASMNGIVGHEMRRVREFITPFPAGATLVMHSDGIGTRWRLDQYPGIRPRHPSLAAAVLYRDFVRGRDDATVVVARAPRVAGT